MKFGKRFVAVILMLILAVSLLSACDPVKDSAESRALCEEMLNNVLANDHDAAYAMMEDACTVGEFDPVWNEMRQVMSGSSSYELKQTGYYYQLADGVTQTSVSFEAVTDDGKVMQIQIVTAEGIEGIAGLHFLDSTEFVKETSFVKIVNIVFIVISVLLLAFVIWMLVDCCRRKIGYKVLWILLILAGVSFSLSVGGGGVNVNFGLFLMFPSWGMTALRTAETVTTKISLPVGAIVYFFLRKRIKLRADLSGTSGHPGTPDETPDGQTTEAPETAEEQTLLPPTDGGTSPDGGSPAENGSDAEQTPAETEKNEQ